MDFVWAFVIGGAICGAVQIFMDKTKLQPGRIMVLMVMCGSLLSALGWYKPFIEFAGAGATVPLLGFGHVLFDGVKTSVQESGFPGLFLGGLKAGALGISAALVFSYIASWIFKPKMK